MAERPCSIRFRGREIPFSPGQPLLRAIGNARSILQRSIRYHRPRSPFCGIGQCTNCLVRVNGNPNVRACVYEPSAGDRVQTENAWPSPGFDLWRALDVFFPRGVDTLHGFRRPASFTPLYHRVVRRLAGFGTFPTPTAAPESVATTEPRSIDCLVVGAGQAGQSAAQSRRQSGDSVVVVDRRASPPGADAGLVEWGTNVVFLPPREPAGNARFRAIAVRNGPEGIEFQAREVVVATGAYDAALWTGGSDTPGVMTADGAFAFASPGENPPFKRAMVFGSGPRAAELLVRFGPTIDAVAAPGTFGPELVAQANALGVELYPRSLLLEVRGGSSVSGVRLAPRGGGPYLDVPADALVLAHRRLPNVQLFFQSGVAMRFDRELGAYLPRVDVGGATSVPGLFAAGSVAAPAPISESPGVFEGYYRELFARSRPRGKFVVCPCEDVLFSEVEAAHAQGYRGIEVLKRYTGLGTGLCQGRYCVPEALLYLSIVEQRPPAEVGYITQRPPVNPVPLAALAALPAEPAGGGP